MRSVVLARRLPGMLCSTALFYSVQGSAQVPSVAPGGVVNGASFAPGSVAPGSIISILGNNLATATSEAQGAPLPTSLGTTSVRINGGLAPLYYVSPKQINAQLPYETALGSASLVVMVGSFSSAPALFSVSIAGPGIFLANGIRAVVQNQDGSANTPTEPAESGSVIVAYLTGQGAVDNPVPTGAIAPASPLSRAVASSSATIGGQKAGIQFLGLTPSLVGVLQVNIQVPNLPVGDYPLW